MNKMKQLITLTLILLSFSTIACDCKWAGNFLTAGVNQDLVIKVKVIEHYKHEKDINEYMIVEVLKMSSLCGLLQKRTGIYPCIVKNER